MKRILTLSLLAGSLTLALCFGLRGVPTIANPLFATAEAATVAITRETTATLWLPLIATGSTTTGATITLSGATATVDGSGVTVSGKVITITTAGTYQIAGTLDDGQIVVDSAAAGAVELLFNGVEITNTTSAPLFVRSAAQVVITLTAGTQNTLTDGAAYVFAEGEDEPDAALYSKADLLIQGDGGLTVNANYKNGLVSNDTLEITGGDITVTAVNHAIKGKDAITIQDGTFALTAGGDGMQADNDEDATLGYITIAGGTFHITAVNDAIQAETALTVNGGDFTFVTGGGSNAVTADSAKGLKAGTTLLVTAVNDDIATFAIDAADDALHSDGSITIDNGVFTLATADDGIHAESAVTINRGTITITQSYEGIEGTYLTINGGEIDLVASDDGINVAGGNDDPLSGNDYYLAINGGYIVVNANGDGLDANGAITMTAGLVLVNGPTTNGNGAIDYDQTFVISGGVLVAAGSAGMAQAPSTTSTQYAVRVNLTTAQAAETLFHLATQSGADLLTFAPTKAYQSVVFSAPTLANGTTYVVHTGGSSTGTLTDGLYTGGVYTAGAQAATFTIASIITTVGSAGSGPGPNGFTGQVMPPGQR